MCEVSLKKTAPNKTCLEIVKTETTPAEEKGKYITHHTIRHKKK